MIRLLNNDLQVGKKLVTYKFGIVTIENMVEDRVYCVARDGVTRLTLSREAAARRAISIAKRNKK